MCDNGEAGARENGKNGIGSGEGSFEDRFRVSFGRTGLDWRDQILEQSALSESDLRQVAVLAMKNILAKNGFRSEKDWVGAVERRDAVPDNHDWVNGYNFWRMLGNGLDDNEKRTWRRNVSWPMKLASVFTKGKLEDWRRAWKGDLFNLLLVRQSLIGQRR